MPDAGQSQGDLIGPDPAPWLAPSDDGTVGVDPETIRELFPQDCDEVTTEQALSRLTRQSLTPFTQPPRQIAWRQKPTTYSSAQQTKRPPPWCSADASDPAPVSSSLTPHHPFLSRPDAFAQTIAAEIDSTGSPSN
jgi:hypothetical protein